MILSSTDLSSLGLVGAPCYFYTSSGDVLCASLLKEREEDDEELVDKD
jgi:hypothetical protein